MPPLGRPCWGRPLEVRHRPCQKSLCDEATGVVKAQHRPAFTAIFSLEGPTTVLPGLYIFAPPSHCSFGPVPARHVQRPVCTGLSPSCTRGTSFAYMARQFDDRVALRLKQMASQEGAATKERLAVRTAAARSFARASAQLEDANAAWERAQTDVAEAKAKAVAELLGTGMQADEVAGLLGIPGRELRALGVTALRRGKKGDEGEAAVPGTGRAEGQQARLAS